MPGSTLSSLRSWGSISFLVLVAVGARAQCDGVDAGCYNALFPCGDPTAVRNAIEYCSTVGAHEATNYPAQATAACGSIDKSPYIAACRCPVNCPSVTVSGPDCSSSPPAPPIISARSYPVFSYPPLVSSSPSGTASSTLSWTDGIISLPTISVSSMVGGNGMIISLSSTQTSSGLPSSSSGDTSSTDTSSSTTSYLTSTFSNSSKTTTVSSRTSSAVDITTMSTESSTTASSTTDTPSTSSSGTNTTMSGATSIMSTLTSSDSSSSETTTLPTGGSSSSSSDASSMPTSSQISSGTESSTTATNSSMTSTTSASGTPSSTQTSLSSTLPPNSTTTSSSMSSSSSQSSGSSSSTSTSSVSSSSSSSMSSSSTSSTAPTTSSSGSQTQSTSTSTSTSVTDTMTTPSNTMSSTTSSTTSSTMSTTSGTTTSSAPGSSATCNPTPIDTGILENGDFETGLSPWSIDLVDLFSTEYVLVSGVHSGNGNSSNGGGGGGGANGSCTALEVRMASNPQTRDLWSNLRLRSDLVFSRPGAALRVAFHVRFGARDAARLVVSANGQLLRVVEAARYGPGGSDEGRDDPRPGPVGEEEAAEESAGERPRRRSWGEEGGRSKGKQEGGRWTRIELDYTTRDRLLQLTFSYELRTARANTIALDQVSIFPAEVGLLSSPSRPPLPPPLPPMTTFATALRPVA